MNAFQSSADVVIVGAGPAGSAAGIQLAKSGLDVVIVENSEFPRHRPGESLHPGVEIIFQALGVDEAMNEAGFLRNLGHEVAWDETGNTVFEAYGSDERGNWYGYQARRMDLDRILLDAARSVGVKILQPCRAIAPVFRRDRITGVLTNLGEMKTNYLIDASGRNSWLKNKLNIPWVKHSPKLICRYGYAKCSKYKNAKMKRDEHGWTWIAPLDDRSCAWVRMNISGEDPGNQYVPEEFLGISSSGPSCGADVTWRISHQVARSGWYLIGDAASVLDPAASRGVLRALMSGMQAAHFIHANFSGNICTEVAAKLYQSWLEEWFRVDVVNLKDLYKDYTEKWVV